MHVDYGKQSVLLCLLYKYGTVLVVTRGGDTWGWVAGRKYTRRGQALRRQATVKHTSRGVDDLCALPSTMRQNRHTHRRTQIRTHTGASTWLYMALWMALHGSLGWLYINRHTCTDATLQGVQERLPPNPCPQHPRGWYTKRKWRVACGVWRVACGVWRDRRAQKKKGGGAADLPYGGEWD